MTDRTKRFEAAALPHLDAAYNLARWLLRDDQNARDVVQEAYLRAFRFFDGTRVVWLPKSQVEWDADDRTMAMPEWLAKDKELI